MSRWMKFQALAQRAAAHWGLAGRQSVAAKSMRKQFYDSLWRTAAKALDATVVTLDDDLLQIESDGRSTRVCQNYTELDDPVSLRIAGRKPLVNRLLSAQDIPVATGLEFELSNWRIAASFLEQHRVCVVKPAAGTGGGQGVTTGIETLGQLRKAVITAAGFSRKLQIERQYAGRNLRLLFLDGDLLDAVERRPPSVRGDGRSTIQQLIAAENRRRLACGHSRAQTVLRIDADLIQTLTRHRMSLRSVPRADEIVQLKTVINDNTAEDNWKIMDELHPDVVSVASRAAAAVGLRLAGVDVLTPDPTQPLEDVRGIILEVNSTPGLHCHYSEQGYKSNVAEPILEACLNTAKLDRDVHASYCGAIVE